MADMTRRAALAALALAGAGAFAPRAAHALEPAKAEAFIEGVANRLLVLIRAEGDFESKRVAFRDLMNETAAMAQIARFAVGPTWRQMSPEQQKRYLAAFPEYLSKIYTRRFDDYRGETMKVLGSRDRGKKGVFVETAVARPGAEALKVEWRVSDRAGPVQIVDIYVEGVSLLLTQREDFKGLLEQSGGDVEAFLGKLTSLSS